MNIKLAFSVRGISKTACMHLSSVIHNGIQFVGCNNEIIVHRNKIEFGESVLPEVLASEGYIYPNYFCKNGCVTYIFGDNLSCSLFGIIDYTGVFTPTEPDVPNVYKELYRICGV